MIAQDISSETIGAQREPSRCTLCAVSQRRRLRQEQRGGVEGREPRLEDDRTAQDEGGRVEQGRACPEKLTPICRRILWR